MLQSKERLEELIAFAETEKKYDAHAHVGYSGGWADVGMTPEQLIRQMDEYRIETTALCSLDNDVTRKMIVDYPGRINGCVYVDPTEKGDSRFADVREKIEYYLTEGGFGAIKLNPLAHSFCADGEVSDPILDIAEKYGVPVVIHSGHPPYSLPWQIGLLAERHPKVKILMIHMGHGHGVYIDAALKMARRYPNIWLEMSGMPMPDKILAAYETVGEDRILFGTDAPYHHVETELMKVLTSGLSEEGIHRVLWENGTKFYQIDK